MTRDHWLRTLSKLDPQLVVLWVFFTVLWFAGGASRADVLGQPVVRVAAWLVIAGLMLFGSRLKLGHRLPVALFLGASVVIAALQLIPLPPSIWQSLPGRDVISDAAALTGPPQQWRPVALVPGATLNALMSLAVPTATLALLLTLNDEALRSTRWLLLVLIVASALIGLLQFSGSGFENPFVNDTPGMVAGMFANRNHLALFLAFGCVLCPPLIFVGGRRRVLLLSIGCAGLIATLFLTILATGSRSGILVGGVGLAIGMLLAWQHVRLKPRSYPSWLLVALPAFSIAVIAIVTLSSIFTNRAVSIDRLVSLGVDTDFRSVAFPTIVAMLRDYFPIGSGFGGFDEKFRMVEAVDLLKVSYYNHAHNDWMEIVLDGGVLGLLILALAVGWWCWMSFRAWFVHSETDPIMAKVGSTLLLLIFIASAFDYPARCPIMLAVIVLAANWLSAAARSAR